MRRASTEYFRIWQLARIYDGKQVAAMTPAHARRTASIRASYRNSENVYFYTAGDTTARKPSILVGVLVSLNSRRRVKNIRKRIFHADTFYCG